jgi:PhoH-like ATPase
MKKTFVIDTNVILQNPNAVNTFDEHDVVVPMAVIRELDQMKKGTTSISYSARAALRSLSSLVEQPGINRSTNIPLPGGGELSIDDSLNGNGASLSPDDQIIAVAERLTKDGKPDVWLVSKDTGVRVKAKTKKLLTDDYRHDQARLHEKYGRLLVDDEPINGIKSVRYRIADNNIWKIRGTDEKKIRRSREVYGITAKTPEQDALIDALTDPLIEFCAISGVPGGGKTLISLACGLLQTQKKSPLYDQLVVARPITPLRGNDLGFLPGTVEDKIGPHMAAIWDAFEMLLPAAKGEKDGVAYSSYPNAKVLIDHGKLALEPLTFIRGRSRPKIYYIIDEAQQLSKLEAKTIIARMGAGAKLIFTGDLHQIDNPFISETSSGLALAIEGFIKEDNFCYLHLPQSCRSRLAEQADTLLQ